MEIVRITRVEYKDLRLGLTTEKAVEEANVEEGRDDEDRENDYNFHYNPYITGVTCTKWNSD